MQKLNITARVGSAWCRRQPSVVLLLISLGFAIVLSLAAFAVTPAATLAERWFVRSDSGVDATDGASDPEDDELTAGQVRDRQPATKTRFVTITAASAWNASSTYTPGAIVVGSDGNHYRATASNTNNNPIVAATRALWEFLAVTGDTTLNVPTRFPTINHALDFIVNARIEGDATLTVQVADGTYNYGSTTVVANHPDGARIVLRGNPSDPSRCKIVWDAYHSGIIVSDGHRLGRVEGFELIGQNDKPVPPFDTGIGLYPPANHGDGIGAYYGASVSVRHCIVRKWLHGVTAWGGSHADVFNTTATDCWDSGLFGYSNSSLYARDCVTDNNSDGDTLGYGIILEGSSSGFLQRCSATGNRIAGVYANDGSCVIMRRCTMTRNGDGILLRAATIEGDKNRVFDNRNGGVHFVAVSGGRLHGTNSRNNARNFWSEENSVMQIGGGENYSMNATVAGFSCKTGGLITGTANVPPANILKNAVDYEKYTPPPSQYLP